MVSSMRLPCVFSRSVQHSSSVATQLMSPSSVPCHSAFWSVGRFEGRIRVIDLPVGQLVVLGRVQHVLVQASRRRSAGPWRAPPDGHDAGGRGHVHHVERGALHVFGQPHDAAEAQILGQRVVHLRHVLEADAALADQLGVHVHDDVVVLGVDDAEPAFLGEHLEHLPDVAEVDHPPSAARPDASGEDLDGGITGLNGLGQLTDLRVRRVLPIIRW